MSGDIQLPNGSQLSESERSRLDELENVIRRGLQSFIQAGEALTEVRDSKLYRATHATFEEYCRDRWNISRPRAYELIASAEVVSGIPDNLPAPSNAGQAVELARVPEPQRIEVWDRAVRSTGGKPTAAAVRQAREQVAPRPRTPPRLVPVPPAPPVSEPDVVEAELVDEPLAASGQGLIDALERHMPGTQADIDRSGIRARWSKNIHAIADIPLMNPEHVAAVLRDLDVSAYRLTIRQLIAWCERLDDVLEPKGLRAIEGGRS